MQKIFVFTAAGHPVSGKARLVAFVVRWLINAVAVWLAAELIDGIHLDGWQTTLTVALFLGILNQFVKPFLVFIGLPFIVLTLGLFLVLINTAMLGLAAWIAGQFDSLHFAIDGFWDAFWGAIIISIAGFILSLIVNPNRVARRIDN